MTDYLKKLDEKIENEQSVYFEKKRYTEGYLDALATIRYAVRALTEQRKKEESEATEKDSDAAQIEMRICPDK